MYLRLDYDFANLNTIINMSRSSVYKANELKKKEMRIVYDQIKNIQPVTEYPVQLTFIWHFKTKQRDLDNCCAKHIIDALVNAEILVNDNLNCIYRIVHESIVDGSNYVEVICNSAHSGSEFLV